ncbi:hypothetical protein Afil01_13150 [Actinorhabdospora filicis]|uniref:Excreted virulence factor EspC, type VII ESX diderm n=1 Tax=Actinorhabdospora filicis TaxID=1785913 RepID=A0A9W6W817_9ACTN|nr:hypothetical protein [Actinorhabdospora filicis]GLZ76508.1 hypothetical protein Afil01_13150 [Actinorhabdospora filicis]
MSFEVQVDALRAYGEGTRSLAEKFGQLSTLLEQARVDDDCFGPALAWLIAKPYYNALDDARETTDKAKTYLEHVRDAVHETAESYGGTEEAIAQAFDAVAKSMESK